MPTGGVVIDPSGGGVDDGEAVVAKSEGGFDRLGEAWGGSAGLEIDAVLDDEDFGVEVLEGWGLVGAKGFSVQPNAQVALAGEEFKKIRRLGLFGNLDREGDDQRFSGVRGEDLAEDRTGSAGEDFAAAFRAECLGGAGEEELEVVVDLGDRADGRARGADIVRLLNGDGRGDALNVVREGFIHPLEELAGVGTESLYIPPLSLGVDGIKGEAGLAAAARPSNDNELPGGKLKVNSLEVILSGSAEPDGIHP